MIDTKKMRILGSGFTAEEYDFYGFSALDNPQDAMRYLSLRQYNNVYFPIVNRDPQRETLKDKWIAYSYLSSMGIAIPRTYGLFHRRFGVACDGQPMCDADSVAAALLVDGTDKIVFKPRRGMKGHHVIVAELSRGPAGQVQATQAGKTFDLKEFLDGLPEDESSRHGWVVQPYIVQHEFFARVNPSSVNSIRVVTFLDSRDHVQIHHLALRFGGGEHLVDNWDRGGISVSIDKETGRLGKGVLKPIHGGKWLSVHPVTGIKFEGSMIPEWESIIDICKRAAHLFPGVRAVGWDVVLTPRGPIINEGNPDWDLKFVQIHSKGYLTEEIREELSRFGIVFPAKLKSLPEAAFAILFIKLRRYYKWQKTKIERNLRQGLKAFQ